MVPAFLKRSGSHSRIETPSELTLKIMSLFSTSSNLQPKLEIKMEARIGLPHEPMKITFLCAGILQHTSAERK